MKRAKQLSVYEWMLERSARLFGTPDDVRKRMHELRGYGVENWYLAVTGNLEFDESMEKLREVLHHL